MKNNSTLTQLVLSLLLSFSYSSFGQTPNLGAAADFVLFSSAGAIGNTGISQLTGNIGTNVGAISGFGNVNGVMHPPDAVTAQAVIDLQAAWQSLVIRPPTLAHGPVLGSGETLFAGVDTLAAAGSLVGALNLDAQGDPNALFIIKTGGALTTAASATVNLINGAVACNVFWVAEGAISMATFTVMRGTLIAHNAAIDMGAGGTIEGRMLSTTGAVSVYGTLAYIPMGCGRPILTGPVAPTLTAAACFGLFSSDETVSNTGTTNVMGDIGTNKKTVTGYNPAFVIGLVHPNPDLSTAQGAADLSNVYTYLNTLPYDIELLYPAQFGNKLVLTPHTYRMNAAAVFTDTLYLDAQGNPDAIFVFQINAALSTSTFSTVRLVNGTQAKNVYWKVEGAVTINDNSDFSGMIVCNGGAIILNTGVALNGRALAIAGTINTTGITVSNTISGSCSIVLPVELLSFTGTCDNQNVVLKWSTATEKDNRYFTVERSDEGINWKAIGLVDGSGNSLPVHNYSLTDKAPGHAHSYYRLKQTDFDGNYEYGSVVVVEKCGGDLSENLTLTPNPSAGEFVLSYSGDKGQVRSIVIVSSDGKKVYESSGLPSKLNLSNEASGVYFVQVFLPSKTINQEIVVKK